MPLLRLGAEGIRNLGPFRLDLSPGLNIITGSNGAGKTSLLEAVHILASGRSFRTSKLRKVTQKGLDSFRIVGEVHTSSSIQSLSMRRNNSQFRLDLDGSPVTQLSCFARLLPVITISSESHQLIEGGPELRRRFLDWGVFHVEHVDSSIWRYYEHALRQRNAALRQGLSIASVSVWDNALIEYGTRINDHRERISHQIETTCRTLYARLRGEASLSVLYADGLPEGSQAFKSALAEKLPLDRERGFTSVGPHRGDLRIRIDGHEVKETLSRGQQKLLATSLLLSQAEITQRSANKPSTILVDDLPSELDHEHRRRFMHILEESGYQSFITTIEDTDLPPIRTAHARFHVEQGHVQKVL